MSGEREPRQDPSHTENRRAGVWSDCSGRHSVLCHTGIRITSDEEADLPEKVSVVRCLGNESLNSTNPRPCFPPPEVSLCAKEARFFSLSLFFFNGRVLCIFPASDTELLFVPGAEPPRGGGWRLTERALSQAWVDLGWRACLPLPGCLALDKRLNLSDPQGLICTLG